MNNIKISVVIPVYNTGIYLRECLDSVLNQTLKDIEIICVDDESTDNSLSVLEEYAKKDDRIIIVNNIHVGEGASSARTAGLNIAKGKYVSFLDSDDYFELDMLEEVYRAAEKYDTDIIMYDAHVFDDNTKEELPKRKITPYNPMPTNTVFNWKDFKEEIFILQDPILWVKLFKREFIIEENLKFQSIKHTDDLLFVNTAMATAKRIYYIDKKFVHYRLNRSTSQATNKEKTPLSTIKSYSELFKTIKKKHLHEELKKAFVNAVTYFCFSQLNSFSIDSYKILYNAFLETYIDEMELETIFENYMYYPYSLNQVKSIKNKDTIYYEDGYFCLNGVCINLEDYTFHKDLAKKSERVLLYGAGHRGVAFYANNIIEKYYNIIAWVDKNPQNQKIKKMNFDVITLDDGIKNIEFDKIIITIKDKNIVEKVILGLESLGIEKEKIVYYDIE